LFIDRGPTQVSLRDVADAANVNVGLIHRYVGTKDELLAAVLETHRSQEDSPVLDLSLTEYLKLALSLDFELVDILRLHARAMLDGYDIRDFQDKFVALDWMIDRFRESVPDAEARARAVVMICLVAGWRMFAPTYLELVNLGGETTDELAKMLAPSLAALVEAPAAGTRRNSRSK
jgi:AcrR family transcriptional regulator